MIFWRKNHISRQKIGAILTIRANKAIFLAHIKGIAPKKVMYANKAS